MIYERGNFYKFMDDLLPHSLINCLQMNILYLVYAISKPLFESAYFISGKKYVLPKRQD